MAFVALNDVLGEVDLSSVDSAGPGYQNLVAGTGSGRQNFYLQTVAGYDPVLGGGEFKYLQYSGTIAAGAVVEMTPSLVGGQMVYSATAWAGTANSGKTLGVAVNAGVAGQFGWFQIGGSAIIACSGSPTAGSPVYWQAAGVVSATAVAGKQMVGAQFATAQAVTLGSGASAVVLASNRAVAQFGRAFAQGAIT